MITLLGAFGEDGGRVHGMQQNEVKGGEVQDVIAVTFCYVGVFRVSEKFRNKKNVEDLCLTRVALSTTTATITFAY